MKAGNLVVVLSRFPLYTFSIGSYIFGVFFTPRYSLCTPIPIYTWHLAMGTIYVRLLKNVATYLFRVILLK